LLGNILGVAVGASVNYAQAAVHVIDFYLDDAREKERSHIIQLVNSQDAESTELLRGYVCEAMRMFHLQSHSAFRSPHPLARIETSVSGSVA
jgi:hypothetical protein